MQLLQILGIGHVPQLVADGGGRLAGAVVLPLGIGVPAIGHVHAVVILGVIGEVLVQIQAVHIEGAGGGDVVAADLLGVGAGLAVHMEVQLDNLGHFPLSKEVERIFFSPIIVVGQTGIVLRVLGGVLQVLTGGDDGVIGNPLGEGVAVGLVAVLSPGSGCGQLTDPGADLRGDTLLGHGVLGGMLSNQPNLALQSGDDDDLVAGVGVGGGDCGGAGLEFLAGLQELPALQGAALGQLIYQPVDLGIGGEGAGGSTELAVGGDSHVVVLGSAVDGELSPAVLATVVEVIPLDGDGHAGLVPLGVGSGGGGQHGQNLTGFALGVNQAALRVGGVLLDVPAVKDIAAAGGRGEIRHGVIAVQGNLDGVAVAGGELAALGIQLHAGGSLHVLKDGVDLHHAHQVALGVGRDEFALGILVGILGQVRVAANSQVGGGDGRAILLKAPALEGLAVGGLVDLGVPGQSVLAGG